MPPKQVKPTPKEDIDRLHKVLNEYHLTEIEYNNFIKKLRSVEREHIYLARKKTASILKGFFILPTHMRAEITKAIAAQDLYSLIVSLFLLQDLYNTTDKKINFTKLVHSEIEKHPIYTDLFSSINFYNKKLPWLIPLIMQYLAPNAAEDDLFLHFVVHENNRNAAPSINGRNVIRNEQGESATFTQALREYLAYLQDKDFLIVRAEETICKQNIAAEEKIDKLAALQTLEKESNTNKKKNNPLTKARGLETDNDDDDESIPQEMSGLSDTYPTSSNYDYVSLAFHTEIERIFSPKESSITKARKLDSLLNRYPLNDEFLRKLKSVLIHYGDRIVSIAQDNVEAAKLIFLNTNKYGLSISHATKILAAHDDIITQEAKANTNAILEGLEALSENDLNAIGVSSIIIQSIVYSVNKFYSIYKFTRQIPFSTLLRIEPNSESRDHVDRLYADIYSMYQLINLARQNYPWLMMIIREYVVNNIAVDSSFDNDIFKNIPVLNQHIYQIKDSADKFVPFLKFITAFCTDPVSKVLAEPTSVVAKAKELNGLIHKYNTEFSICLSAIYSISSENIAQNDEDEDSNTELDLKEVEDLLTQWRVMLINRFPDIKEIHAYCIENCNEQVQEFLDYNEEIIMESLNNVFFQRRQSIAEDKIKLTDNLEKLINEFQHRFSNFIANSNQTKAHIIKLAKKDLRAAKIILPESQHYLINDLEMLDIIALHADDIKQKSAIQAARLLQDYYIPAVIDRNKISSTYDELLSILTSVITLYEVYKLTGNSLILNETFTAPFNKISPAFNSKFVSAFNKICETNQSKPWLTTLAVQYIVENAIDDYSFLSAICSNQNGKIGIINSRDAGKRESFLMAVSRHEQVSQARAEYLLNEDNTEKQLLDYDPVRSRSGKIQHQLESGLFGAGFRMINNDIYLERPEQKRFCGLQPAVPRHSV